MTEKQIASIFADTAFVRTGGSAEERRCANYLAERCREIGITADYEPFDVEMAEIRRAQLFADGQEIVCKGYLCSGSADVEAPLLYMPETGPAAMERCKGCIVLLDSGVRYWVYRDLLKYGAVGFITYDGDVNNPNNDIDQKELRAYISEGQKLPGVCVHARDAVALVRNGVERVRLLLEQEETIGASGNLIAELPGETDQWIAFTAHYDSTSLSEGAYDNMSGCVGLLGIAEHFVSAPHRLGLRFIWCGSEERGLLGSKAYTAAHTDALQNTVLNINLDMIGSIMGKFFACCTTEEDLVRYLKYFADEMGILMDAKQDVYSSDSTPFADHGVPALSFARLAPQNTAAIHNSFDTAAVLLPGRVAEDVEIICAFADRIANARRFPIGREIPQNMKDKLDVYLNRKKEEDLKKG